MSKGNMLSCVAIGDASGKTRITLDQRSTRPFMINQGQSTVALKQSEAKQVVAALTMLDSLLDSEE